ncbi:hypothetical protein EDB84DRAFT_1442430 [Lactarius hengduanensis]|nr:hypothetical protein EDB84DRAFT_1442430 [Lactarius hengduanensis]
MMLEPLAYTVDGSGTFNGIDVGMVWLKAGDWQSKFKLATHRMCRTITFPLPYFLAIIMAERPKRTNANTHLGRILLDNKQKCRTPAEKAAMDKEEAERKADAALKIQMRRKEVVIRIAKLKDALQKEDRAYPNSTCGNGATYRKAELNEDNTSGLAIVADPSDNLGERADARDGEDAPMLDTKKLQVNAAESEDNDTDDEYHNDPDTDEDGDEDESGDDEEGDENEDKDKEDGETSSDSDIKERKSKKKGKQATKKGKGKQATKKKKKRVEYGLRDDVTLLRKSLPALPLGLKRKPEPISQKYYSDEETLAPSTCVFTNRSQKRPKYGSVVAVASGLQSDWRKLVGSPVTKAHSKLKTTNTSSRPSSQASLWSNAPNASASQDKSQGTDDVRAHWQPSTPGAFDDDEGSTSLKAALAAKRKTTTTTPTSHVMPYRATTSNPNRQITPSMGLAIKKVDVNITAGLIQDPTIKNDGNNASKPYRYLKASDIPVTGEFELAKWDLLVRGVLDWAGTLHEPFGTNEHPNLLGTINDRLNEWRSAFGKKAIQVLGDHVKADVTLRNSPTDTVSFVHGLLPSPREQPLEFPLIYSNPMVFKLKGSWQAPLLLQVFATHLRRVVKSPGNFGYPAGALALSTAALERALTQLESSTNRNMKTTGFDNNPWGGITSQYAESTHKLPDRKWAQILEAVSVYLVDRSGGKLAVLDTISSGRTNIVVSDEEEDLDMLDTHSD